MLKEQEIYSFFFILVGGLLTSGWGFNG